MKEIWHNWPPPLTPKRDQVSNFPCNLTRNITSNIKNLSFHSLLKLRDHYCTILITSLVHFSLQGWANLIFQLGSERVKSYQPNAEINNPESLIQTWRHYRGGRTILRMPEIILFISLLNIHTWWYYAINDKVKFSTPGMLRAVKFPSRWARKKVKCYNNY